MRALAASLLVSLLAAGCAGSDPTSPSEREGTGTDPSLPGVRVSGNATWDGDSWMVHAEARNEGTQTYRTDTGCGTPFILEAKAEKGEQYGELRCLAYTPPAPFQPGGRVERTWDVHPEEFQWSGRASFAVVFEDAEDVGRIRVPLE